MFDDGGLMENKLFARIKKNVLKKPYRFLLLLVIGHKTKLMDGHLMHWHPWSKTEYAEGSGSPPYVSIDGSTTLGAMSNLVKHGLIEKPPGAQQWQERDRRLTQLGAAFLCQLTVADFTEIVGRFATPVPHLTPEQQLNNMEWRRNAHSLLNHRSLFL